MKWAKWAGEKKNKNKEMEEKKRLQKEKSAWDVGRRQIRDEQGVFYVWVFVSACRQWEATLISGGANARF